MSVRPIRSGRKANHIITLSWRGAGSRTVVGLSHADGGVKSVRYACGGHPSRDASTD